MESEDIVVLCVLAFIITVMIYVINELWWNYKHIKNLVVTNEPMIKTTTAKVKRFEEMKKMNEKKDA